MNKLLTCLLIASLAVTNTTAQTSLKNFNDGEMAFVRGDYDLAITGLTLGYLNGKNHLATDLYNAIVCALITNKKAQIKDFSLELADRGVEKTVIESLIKQYPDHWDYWKSFEQEYDERHKAFQANKDVAMIQWIQKLYDADRKFYSAKRDDQTLKRPLQDSLEVDSFMNVLKKKWLDETQIGVQMYEGKISALPLFYILIWHRFQDHNYDMNDAVIAAYKNNLLHPEAAFGILNHNPAYHRGLFLLDCNNVLYANHTLETSINDIRLSLNLCSTTDLKQKLKYQRSHQDSPFIFHIEIIKMESCDHFLPFFTPL